MTNPFATLEDAEAYVQITQTANPKNRYKPAKIDDSTDTYQVLVQLHLTPAIKPTTNKYGGYYLTDLNERFKTQIDESIGEGQLYFDDLFNDGDIDEWE